MGKVIGFAMLWALGTLISFVIELKTFGSYDMTTWYTLVHPQLAEATSTLGMVTGFINAGKDWLQALGNVLTWNYAFFTGWTEIIRYVVFFSFTIGFLWMLISLLRGTSSE